MPRDPRLLALVSLLLAFGCADHAGPDPDEEAPPPDGVEEEEEPWVPPEVPEEWEDGFDVPDGVLIEEVEGRVSLPEGFAFPMEDLSVRTWFGGRRPVDEDGRFITAVNREGTAAVELLDPDGATLMLVAHPESDYLEAMDIDVSVDAALASALLMSPGWIVTDPSFSEPLLRLFQGREAFAPLVAEVEADLLADPYTMLEPSDEAALGLAEVAEQVLDLVPGVRDEFMAMLQASFGPFVGDEGRAYDEVPAGCVISSPVERAEDRTATFRDLDGCPRDMVVFEGVEVTDGGNTLKIERIENHAGRPVWIYLDADSSEWDVFPEPADKSVILSVLGSRKLSLPTITGIVSRLAAEVVTVLGRFIGGDDATTVLNHLGERTLAWLETHIETGKEETLEIDITGYGRSVVSVYGLGTMYDRGQQDQDFELRHAAPFIHGILSQFVLPLLKMVANQQLNSGYERWEPWVGVIEPVTELFNQLTNIFQPGVRNHNVGETVWSILSVLKGEAGKLAQAAIELGAISLGAAGNSSAGAAEARITNLLTVGFGLIIKQLAPWRFLDAVVEGLNMVTAMTLGTIAIATLDWTDKYILDPGPISEKPPTLPDPVPDEPLVCDSTPTPSGEVPTGDFLALARTAGAGGLARFRWNAAGDAVEQVDAAPAGQDSAWGQLFAIADGGARGFDIGGETGGLAFVSVDDGTLRIIDLDDTPAELDADRDGGTSDAGAPAGVTRLEAGWEPRGVHAFHRHPFVAVATETEVVVFDSVFRVEVARFGPALLGLLPDASIGYQDRPYDITTTPDDGTMFVSLPGTFLNDGDRVVMLDLTSFLRDRTVLPTRIDPDPAYPGEDLDLGDDPNPRWLELSPDGTKVAVTLTDTDRIAILETCYGQASGCVPGIYDVHPGQVWASFLTSTPDFESSAGARTVTWADDQTLFAGYDYGHGRLGGAGVVRKCWLDYGYEACDGPAEASGVPCPAVYGQCGHEVGVTGHVRGLAVFGTDSNRRVVVGDDQGWTTVLRDELFEAEPCFVGTAPQPYPYPDGTGGCVEDWGGFEMRAVSCTDVDATPNLSPFGTFSAEAIIPFAPHHRDEEIEEEELPIQIELHLQTYQLQDAPPSPTPTWDPVVASCAGGRHEGDLVIDDAIDFQLFCAQYSTVGGDLTIIDSGLQSAWVGSCLCEVEGDLILEDNLFLQGVEAWSYLHTVGGDLVVGNNANLATLAGFISLTEVGGSLRIEGNPSLQTVRALQRVQSVGGDLSIQDNPRVPAANAQEVVDAIDSVGGTTTVGNNGP